MAKAKPFDVATFLATGNGEGRRVTRYRNNEVIVSQGHPCDAVFYIREGKCKVTVLS